MGSKREKYPEKCPWDLGPKQHLAEKGKWTLRSVSYTHLRAHET